ncbi:MAG TPA: bifunctional transaldolase/phosoglucose isomerase, partial [Acidobacteriota bacterium]|nr:bifunctional transaldolase/phosoglucose isomerase [Acidobacteriota bacterium]
MATISAGVTNPLKELQRYGQSIWLDYIRRGLITSGELRRLIEEDGLRGVTSNPSIFEKAIGGSADYDQDLQQLLTHDPRTEIGTLYESLVVNDVRMAADSLRSVYDETGGGDGYVSLEVSPLLAHDEAGTIAEAKRLWKEVDRPNIMIKVPATPEGIPAIEKLIGAGINVNITLMFSLGHYEAVAQAYLRGLEKSPDPRRVASVASFFVSRVDTVVDRSLDAVRTPEATSLKGKIAIANSRLVYQRFREIFHGKPFESLRRRGARVQRVLWASTGTKNPAYSDILYVQELIGPDTVNTLPPATLNAFRDHGKPRPTLDENVEAARAALSRLKSLGIDLNQITEQLLADGVEAFATSFNSLKAGLDKKRRAILEGQLDRQTLSLGEHQVRVDKRLEDWQGSDFAGRLWRKDPTLWFPNPVPELTNRLGWLHLPEMMQDTAQDLIGFAEAVKAEGIRHVVLLGMGGSSLAPEVFQRTLGNASGYPALVVLDSTHPDSVLAVEKGVDLRHALFLVSSKSGTTTEPLSFFYYFWQCVSRMNQTPGSRFVAITDPGTQLEKMAGERGFRRVFRATPDVGGRYSALTAFGLVPAALIGVDVHTLLERAWTMGEACASCRQASENPGLALGAALGELALAGRDKVTYLTTSSLAAFPAWAEQLIAESTGKDEKGIVPVASEPPGGLSAYGADRVFVHLGLQQDPPATTSSLLEGLKRAGHPVIEIRLAEKADLGQEFFRWEFAVAAAGAILGIHPFNQPDVELAKKLARKAMTQGSSAETGKVNTISAEHADELRKAVQDWVGSARSGDYFGIQAYLAPTRQAAASLEELQKTLRDVSHLATTLGFGPRFLHST